MPWIGVWLAALLGGCLSTPSIGQFRTSASGTSGLAGAGTGASASSGSAGSTSGSSGTAGSTGGRLPPGAPCTGDGSCASNLCGISGVGHCCAQGCSPTQPPCGALDCDEAGACLFPDAGVACGEPSFCTASVLTTPNVCNGQGACAGAVDCAPFACAANGCASDCLDSSGCATGSFCDTANLTCCAEIESGGDLVVDALLGDDATPCCGFGARPCRTIGHAMQLIDGAAASGVTIHASVSGDGGDWRPSGETYPVVLGWDVELSAPGVYFIEEGGAPSTLFAIAAYSARDFTGGASVFGSSDAHVGIGIDPLQSQQTRAGDAIQVESGETLYLTEATLNGPSSPAYPGSGVHVAAGADLVLGEDRSGAVRGRVNIGTGYLEGVTGIRCDTDGISQGGTVTDAPLAGESSVVIQNQAFDIDARDFSVVSLTSAPVLGVAPSKPGFLKCPSRIDGRGVFVGGAATVTFSNGFVQCIGGDGFETDTGDATRTPALTISNTIIQNTLVGIQADTTSSITVANSVLRYNNYGISCFSDGCDLSGGALGGRNTIVCSSEVEFGYPESQGVGLEAGAAVNASNVDWDTPGPDVFACIVSGALVCTCESDNCTRDAGADGMDIVLEGGSVTTAGNGVAAYDCTVPLLDGGP